MDSGFRRRHDKATMPLCERSRWKAPALDVTAVMGGPAHEALSLNRRRTHGQRRALREMPCRSQLRQRGGHRQPGKLHGRDEFILETSHLLNQLRQLHHLHRRKNHRRRNLAVSDGIARAGHWSVVLASIVFAMLVIAIRAASLHRAAIWPKAARRSRDHQGQHKQCEDLPESFHQESGVNARRQPAMVKAGVSFGESS